MKSSILVFLIAFAVLTIRPAQTLDTEVYWMKVAIDNKFDRSVLANMGVTIDIVQDDYVIATGSYVQLQKIKERGWLAASTAILSTLDYPKGDEAFHNYTELLTALDKIKADYSDIAQVTSIGKTVEGRDIYSIRISEDLNSASQKPGIIFMGGHHAREHISVEMPLKLAQHLLAQYRAGDNRIMGLVRSRDIHIIPVVNPDGMEYDIATGKYKMWRKNRFKNANGTFGVDLNRNYGFKWGTGGSSSNPSDDTYKGTHPFSELETQAIKQYVETNKNLSILLSFHTYSELILYPWGHKYESIENAADKEVHEVMAQKMAGWNGYTPQQSSELYIASGDTTDWSYGELGLISFTFELDPKNDWRWGFGKGFYPGASYIDPVFQKNLEPSLYLMEHADNPYRAASGRIGI